MKSRTALIIVLSALAVAAAAPALAAQDWAGRQFPAGHGNASMDSADLDADGAADVVTAASSDNAIAVLLADGAGGFLPASSFAMGSQPLDVALADLDDDGDADAVSTVSGGLALRLGDGAGGFLALAALPEVTPGGLVVADFDADGDLDLAATLGSTAKVRVWLGNGAGGLLPGPLGTVGQLPAAIDAGDLDADGLPDVATANAQGASFSLLLSAGGGSFTPAPNLPAVGLPRDVLFGDVNEDGLLDLLTSTHSHLTTRLGNGAGGFSATLDIADGAETLALQDLDGDGWLDLLGHHPVDERVLVRRGEQGPSFGAMTLLYAGLHVSDEAALDLDADGVTDLVACSASAPYVTVLRGQGFAQYGAPAVSKLAPEPDALVVADVDNDGDLDALTSNAGGNANVARNDGAGHFLVSVLGSQQGSDLAAGLLNSDGNLDVVTVSEELGQVRVFLGTGAGGFVAAGTYSSNLTSRVALGDLDADGDVDVALAGAGLGVMFGDGTFALAPPQFLGTPDAHVGLAIGDLDLDGNPDLAGLRLSPSRLVILLGDGAGGFAAPVSVPIPAQPQALALGDVTGDGAPEVVTAHAADQLVLLVNDGSGQLVQQATLAPGLEPRDVILADADGDGRLDLVSANAGGANVGVLRGLPGGGFAAPLFYAGGSEACAVAVADFDADLRADLLVVDRSPELFSCDITLLRNAGPPQPWVNVGHGLAGTAGVPMLVGTGTLQPAATTSLLLHGGKPAAPAFLAIGAPAIDAPFKGGVLVPAPSLLLGLATNGAGEFTGSGSWPAGMPSGLTIWFQAWIVDAAAVKGLAASNAVGATAP